MNDFWLTKNNKATNTYMDEVAKESNFTDITWDLPFCRINIYRCYGESDMSMMFYTNTG
ncbi:hypothetical protein [Cohnella abietis]|uniref:Uncharacterized protein n=1 Tax=Cohnella abietis TaxID=2507935 RepID=A0A3T1D8B8_9BACL|nr:hypothetical protein [Cohnella abietis]BBI34330.1 hypothetical protein KCTCHS21_37290 [Cohnella abietis]